MFNMFPRLSAKSSTIRLFQKGERIDFISALHDTTNLLAKLSYKENKIFASAIMLRSKTEYGSGFRKQIFDARKDTNFEFSKFIDPHVHIAQNHPSVENCDKTAGIMLTNSANFGDYLQRKLQKYINHPLHNAFCNFILV